MSTFVGRDRELHQLMERLDRAIAGKGGVLFITGEAGAGKSTLTERFLVEAALRAPDARILVATCSEQFGAGEPYQPFVEAFRALVTEGQKTTTEGKSKLSVMARQLAPYWLSAIPVAGNVLAATMATAVEVQKARSGEVATAPPSEEALFFQYTELLLAAADEYPVVLFIDDLHWADQASVSLLGHVGRKIADKPVLMIGTYRPADVLVTKHPIHQARLELQRYGVAEELAVQPLDSAALAQLLREELGGPVTPELRRWLEQRAGSNPLFFGELLKWLREQGLCVEREGEWGLATIPATIEIPSSAEGVIEKRLGRLDEEIRRILEYAAVQGDEFGSTTLARQLDMDELELEETLENLARVHQLIRLTETRDLPNGDISSIYLFSHSLIQDVLHRALQGKRRILMHRKVAQILSEIYAKDLAPVDHMLAVHYEEGRQPEQAFEAAMRAAERASNVYAHQDAVELYRRAVANSPDDEKKASALARLAEEFHFTGKYAEAVGSLDEALTIAQGQGDRPLAIQLRRKRVGVELEYGKRTASELIQELERLAEEARSLGEKAELCEILWSFRHLPTAETDESTGPAAFAEALAVAEQLERPELVAWGHFCVGHDLMLREDPAKALPHLQEARRRYEELGNPRRSAFCSNCLAIVQLQTGDYGTAVADFDAAAEALKDAGDPVNRAAVQNNLGVLQTRTGEYERARETLEEALRVVQRLNAATRELPTLQNLADLHMSTGELESAKEHWELLRKRAEETGYTDVWTIGTCGVGLVQLLSGDAAAAGASLEEGRAKIGDDGEWSEGREALCRLQARLALAAGDAAGAERVASEAEQALENGDRYLWATFRLLRAEAVAADRPAEAAELARQALETFTQLGTEPMRKEAEERVKTLRGGS